MSLDINISSILSHHKELEIYFLTSVFLSMPDGEK